MNAKTGTPEGDELEILVTLVGACETEHFPMCAAWVVTTIQFRMDQQGPTRKD
jgi:HTH-type transcriptional regulator/antitoxin HigA